MTTKEQLIKEIDQAPDFLVEEVLNFLLFLKIRLRQKTSGVTTPNIPLSDDRQTFLEAISQITAQVSQDDWKTLPSDLSKNLDHYLYGAPKAEK